jgi:hypothetical protein
MSDVQGGYNARIGKPSPGTIEGCDFNTATGNCETAAGIAFGKPVSQGSGDKGVVLGGALANFLGVTVRDITQVDATVLDKYPQYKNVGYLSRGQIWVEASVAVGANDPVHYDTTTGAWKISGGIGPIVGARYVTSGAAGDRVVIELQAR